jgi:hypothetical protein
MQSTTLGPLPDRRYDLWEPFGHSRVRATAPIRRLVSLLLTVMLLGPQSFRLGSRDPDAVLGAATNLGFDALIHSSFIVAGAIAAVALLFTRPVRRYYAAILRDSRFARVALRAFLVWAGLAGVSLLWTLAPQFTLLSWLRLVATAGLLAIVVALGRDRLTLVRFFWWYSAVKCGLIVVLGLLDPSLVGRSTELGFRLTGGVLPDYGVSGFLLVASSLGLLLARRAGGCVPPPLRRPAFAVSIIVFGSGFALLGRSRYVILALLILLVAAAWAYRARFVGALALGSAAIFAIVDSPMVTNAAFDVLFRGRDNVLAFSERDRALEHVLVWSADRQLLGGGFASGSRTAMADFMARTGIALGAPHDVVSTVVPDLGWAGTAVLGALVLTMLLGLVVVLSRLREQMLGPLALFAVASIVLAFASSASGPGVAGPDMFSSLPFIAVVLMLSQQRRSRVEDAMGIPPTSA